MQSETAAEKLGKVLHSTSLELEELRHVLTKCEGLRPYGTRFDFLNKISMSSPDLGDDWTLSDIARAANEQVTDHQRIVRGLDRFCFLMRVTIFEVSQALKALPAYLGPNLILGSLFGSQGTIKPCQNLASAANVFRIGEVSKGLTFLTLVGETTEEVLYHRNCWDDFGKSREESDAVKRLSRNLDVLRGSISFGKLKKWMLGEDNSLPEVKRWRLVQCLVRSRRPVRGPNPSCDHDSRSVTLLNSIREVREFETDETMYPIVFDEELSRQDVMALVPWFRVGSGGERYYCDGDKSWAIRISHEKITSTDRRGCYLPADIEDLEKKSLTTWIRRKFPEVRECPSNISTSALRELGDLSENGAVKLAERLQTWRLGKSVISNAKVGPAVIANEMGERFCELWPEISRELWSLRDNMGPRSLTESLDLAAEPAKWVRWFLARTVAPVDNAYLICHITEGVHVELSTTTGPQKNSLDVGYDNLNGLISVCHQSDGLSTAAAMSSWEALLHHLNKAQIESDSMRWIARGIDVLRQRLTLGRPSVHLTGPSDISARTDCILHPTEIEEVDIILKNTYEFYDKRNQENG